MTGDKVDGGAGDSGTITAFVVVLSTALLLVAGLVLDGGLAVAAHVRASTAAQSAARVGAQQLDLAAYRESGTLHVDPGLSAEAAARYLDRTGETGTVVATTDLVTVTVTASQPTRLLSLIGMHRLTVGATASARPHLVAPP